MPIHIFSNYIVVILDNGDEIVLSIEAARELWGKLGAELEKITPDAPECAPEP